MFPVTSKVLASEECSYVYLLGPNLLLLSYYMDDLRQTSASCSAEKVLRVHAYSGINEL